MLACQICGKYDHIVDTYRFRNSDTTFFERCQVCGKQNHSAQFCLFETYNVLPSPATINAMHVTASAPPLVPTQPSPQLWFIDSGN